MVKSWFRTRRARKRLRLGLILLGSLSIFIIVTWNLGGGATDSAISQSAHAQAQAGRMTPNVIAKATVATTILPPGNTPATIPVPVTDNTPVALPVATGPLGTRLAAMASAMQDHLYGPVANQYDVKDAVLQGALNYWKSTCYNPDGSFCDEAKSGSLQCVEFVTGVFASLGDPLPVSGIGQANQFWQLYQRRAGWQEIPVGGLPQPGDMVAWSEDPDPVDPTQEVYGHLALVVAVQAPVGLHDGFIKIAQANAPGSMYPGSGHTGNFYLIQWHGPAYLKAHQAEKHVPEALVSWPRFHVQGFIRQLNH